MNIGETTKQGKLVSDIFLSDCIGQDPSAVHAPFIEGTQGHHRNTSSQDTTKYLH